MVGTHVYLPVDHVRYDTGTVWSDSILLKDCSRVSVWTFFLVSELVVVGPEPAATEPTGIRLLTCSGENKEININNKERFVLAELTSMNTHVPVPG